MYLCQYDFVKQNYIRYDRDTDDDAIGIECIKKTVIWMIM